MADEKAVARIVSGVPIGDVQALHDACKAAQLEYRLAVLPGRYVAVSVDERSRMAAQAIIDNWQDPEPPYDKLRLEAYRNAWSHAEFEEAVLEHFQGDSTKLDALLVRREAIRKQYPKPETKKKGYIDE
jgi:hypothetical protein